MQSTYRLEADKPGPDYHSDPAASSGFLKTAKNRSWAHAQHGRLHPHEPTPAMSFGTAWHAAFFEQAADFGHALLAAPCVDRGLQQI